MQPVTDIQLVNTVLNVCIIPLMLMIWKLNTAIDKLKLELTVMIMNGDNKFVPREEIANMNERERIEFVKLMGEHVRYYHHDKTKEG